MNVVILTKDEWQAFELVIEVHRQMEAGDTLLVWDDCSSPQWLAQMKDIAEVKIDPANKNLSDHRNRVKAHIPPGEWIVMIDADERIQPGFLAALNAKIKLTDCDAMWLERHNTYWDSRGQIVPPSTIDYAKPFDPDYQPRLFRNLPEIHFENPIHHVLNGHKKAEFLKGPPFTIIHHRQNCPRQYENFVPDYGAYVRQLQGK